MADAFAPVAVVDTPEVLTPEVDTPEIDVTDGGDTSDTDTDGLEPISDEPASDDSAPGKPERTDGRTLPADLKTSLSELRKTNPKMAKQIQEDYFKVRQIEALGFKSTSEVKAFKETIDNITALNGETGMQAIEALQADAQEFHDEMTAFAQGEGSLLVKLQKANADGFNKLVPQANKIFKETNPQEYAKFEESVIDTAFSANNVYSHIEALTKAISEGNQAEANRLAKGLQGWVNGKQGKGNPTVDKEREAVQTERQQWETQKATEAQATFEKNMYGGLNPVVTNKVKTLIAGFLPKGYKLPAETENLMLTTIFGQIDGKLQEKEDYISRASAIFKTKDQKRVHNFMLSRIDPHLLPLTKAVVQQFRGAVPAAKKAVVPGVKPTTGNNPLAKGAQARKPSLQEAMDAGFSKNEYLTALTKKKLEKNGKTYFAW